MANRATTLSKFIIEDQQRAADPQPELTSLLNDIQTACKRIAVATARGLLLDVPDTAPTGTNTAGEQQKPLDLIANTIMVETCEGGGQLAGMVSEEIDDPYPFPPQHPRGRYLLSFDPVDGSSGIDVNGPLGTIFSVLRCPEGVVEPTAADFLQPGTKQVAAGYAIYGHVCMMVLTLGDGVHGFTLDPDIGAFSLTHPNMRIPHETREFAVNISNERFWDPPVRRYVQECILGVSGPRNADFNMRWIASMVGEVHRILIRGGLYMYPHDVKEPRRAGRLRLLYEANPMAMIVEQAGGAATDGRTRLLDLVPTSIHQRVPVILGSRAEVERLERYHAQYDRGEDVVFNTPLFQSRSLFRTV